MASRTTWILLPVVVLTSFTACSVRRVPTNDPRATAPDAGAVYEPQRESASPPAPAVEPAPQSTAEPPSLEVPQPADFDTPAVAVQDLVPPPPTAAAAPSAATSTEPSGAPSGAPSAEPAPGVAGFRVQVSAGSDAAVAEQLRQEVESRLGTRAYIAHEAPYYKVRVGDCPTKEACRELLERLRAAGYDAVWVVPDQIAR